MYANYVIEKLYIITVTDFENPRVGGSNPPSGTILPVLEIEDTFGRSRACILLPARLLSGMRATKKPEQRWLLRLLLA